jgi:hypothetical protein
VTAARYHSYLIARGYLEQLSEVSKPEQEVLADAAEGFLLARSPEEDGLENSIDSACWALTHLTVSGLVTEAEAACLWEAICNCAPAGVAAGIRDFECDASPGRAGSRSGPVMRIPDDGVI